MAELEPDSPVEPAVGRWLIVVAAAAGVVALLYLLQPILLPFVLGGLIGYLGDPLVDGLERHRVNRTLSVVIVFLLFTALMIARRGLPP